jgi:hypothetical protein
MTLSAAPAITGRAGPCRSSAAPAGGRGRRAVQGKLRPRVLDLGATLLTSQPVVEDDWRWHRLADPDGNEFCVLQPPA